MRLSSYLLVLIAFSALAYAQQTTPTKPLATHPPQQTNTTPSAAQGAPAPAPRPGHIVTGTRLVSIFSRMENEFFTAVQKKDKDAVEKMCTDDFSIWMPNESGDPLPLEDWLQSMATDYTLKSFKIRHMSAHDLGGPVVVKFEVGQMAEYKGKEEGGEYFVVDVWMKDGDSWKVSDRYISRYSAAKPAATPVKPTGKQ
ncbi:MAG: hypothetical protein DMG65_25030 [Candidatus Angelobacter sp. Gp1-AA117]|nr:MAG: hypothetical protein DMG65_25030 [Candidatus Angelobacter sp. Gp1-AA117]